MSLHKFIYTLLLSVSFTYCIAQVHTNTSGERSGQKQPKMIKTHGTNLYANVRCGLQDKKGNLWFGTIGEGVYRYDGKNFRQFTVTEGLSHNTVWSMTEDKAGNIWLGTEAGLCRYDGKNIVTVPISIPPNNASEKCTVWTMLKDQEGKLWFATSSGIYCYNGTSFSYFLDNDSIDNKAGVHLKSIHYMLEDRNGNIWFGAGASQAGPKGLEGLCCYDGKKLTSFKPDGDGWIRYITEDKNGTIWFGTRQNGNWRYDGKTYTKYTDKTEIGAPVLADKKGNIWFSGEEHDNGYANKNGVWCFDGNSFKNYSTSDGLGNFGVWTIIEDKTGNIWFGTRNNGLYRFDGKSFLSFSE